MPGSAWCLQLQRPAGLAFLEEFWEGDGAQHGESCSGMGSWRPGRLGRGLRP